MIRIIQPQNARNGRRRCSIARGAYRSSYCCCCLVGFFFAGLRKIIVIFPERKHLGLARARSPLRLQQHNYHHRIEREIEIVLGNLDDEIYRARVEEIKKKKNWKVLLIRLVWLLKKKNHGVMFKHTPAIDIILGLNSMRSSLNKKREK